MPPEKPAIGPTLVDSLVAIGVERSCIEGPAEDFYAPRRLGEHLVSIGCCTEQQLTLALAHQAAARHDFATANRYLGVARQAAHLAVASLVADIAHLMSRR